MKSLRLPRPCGRNSDLPASFEDKCGDPGQPSPDRHDVAVRTLLPSLCAPVLRGVFAVDHDSLPPGSDSRYTASSSKQRHGPPVVRSNCIVIIDTLSQIEAVSKKSKSDQKQYQWCSSSGSEYDVTAKDWKRLGGHDARV